MPIYQDIQHAVENFVKSNLKKWAELEVLPEAISAAAASGLPRKFINNIRIAEENGEVKLTNDWLGVNYHTGVKDVPLAYIFEYGTKRNYPIVPVYAKALHWREAIKSISILGTPGTDTIDHFAQRVIHPGFPPSLAMQQGWERGMKRLQNRVSREVNKFIKEQSSRYQVEVNAQ